MPTDGLLQRIKQTPLYQRTLAEGVRIGELKEARALLIRQGMKRFGEIPASTLVALEMIQEIDQLEALCDLMVEPDLRCWDDLFRGFRSPPDEPNPSSTCERILKEGREIGRIQMVRRLLQRVGSRKFGTLDIENARRVRAIQDLDQLEALAERLVDDGPRTWTDFLNRVSA